MQLCYYASGILMRRPATVQASRAPSLVGFGRSIPLILNPLPCERYVRCSTTVLRHPSQTTRIPWRKIESEQPRQQGHLRSNDCPDGSAPCLGLLVTLSEEEAYL